MTADETLPTLAPGALQAGQPALADHKPPRSLAGQMVRFLLVGVTNTIVGLGVFAVANRLGVWYPVASALAFGAGALNGYTLNRVWTFQAGAYHRSGFARYMVVQLIALTANELAIVALVDGLRLEHILAQVVSLVCVSILTFGLNRQWAFAPPTQPVDPQTP